MNVSIGGIARTVEITSFDKLGDVKVCMLTTTADGSVGFQQLNQEVVDTIYASFPVDTSKGSIASFEDGADNIPVRELKLNLEPYQNLNGYDSPWVGGGNGNYLPNNATDGTTTLNGITLKEANGVYSLSGTASAETTFNISLSVSVDLSPSTNKICFLNSAAYSAISVGFTRSGTRIHYWSITPSNRVISGWTDSGNEVIDGIRIVIANGTAISGTLTISPMLVKTTDTSPTSFTPYSNICPIYPNNGKNLLPCTINSQTINGVTFTVNGDGSIVANGTASATTVLSLASNLPLVTGQKYVLNGCPSGGNISNYYKLDIHYGTNDSYSVDTGSGVSFTYSPLSSSPANEVRIVIYGGQVCSSLTFCPMIRPVEITDPTYVPYNAIGITRTGANLWDEQWELGGIGTNNGIPYNASTSIRSKNFCSIAPSTTYYIKGSCAVIWYDGNQNFISTDYADNNTKTSPNNAQYFKLAFYTAYGTTYNHDISVNYPSSVQTYEPYQGERYYPISDNPVYGGTLEVETGVLTVTHGYWTENGTAGWNRANNGDFFVWVPWASGAIQSNDGYCNYSPYEVNFTGYNAFVRPTNSTVTLGSKWGDIYPDTTSLKSAFASNPLQLVYPLASPLVYQLTPTQVKTLLGYNNIWTDSGTVEVQYRANIGLYIQKIIGATEDDMVANQNISANKYFFVGEELYYSTSAISAGQTIIVGTNCIKTNLADALNALNS